MTLLYLKIMKQIYIAIVSEIVLVQVGSTREQFDSLHEAPKSKKDIRLDVDLTRGRFAPSYKLPTGKDGAMFRIPQSGILPCEEMKQMISTISVIISIQYSERQHSPPEWHSTREQFDSLHEAPTKQKGHPTGCRSDPWEICSVLQASHREGRSNVANSHPEEQSSREQFDSLHEAPKQKRHSLGVSFLFW
jgi:hypothetical protein